MIKHKQKSVVFLHTQWVDKMIGPDIGNTDLTVKEVC